MGFSKLLVANRGEIAVRVIRTARQMGYSTVAVFSEADANAPHVREADQAVCIGPPEVGASYLSVERILEAAKLSGADAIHPGYGFLSENSTFVRACEEAGLVFVGPGADVVDLMGNKREAKKAMEAAGIPCIPGYQGEDQGDERFLSEAQRIGYPVILKAAMGGGGRGMRIVHEEGTLAESLRSARAEAQNAFGDGTLLLERALLGARHVEVQVIADAHGNTIHLGERDCSIQRRYQKVIEEAPSPAVDAELRARMGKTAVDVASSCGYTNAGTVEFLLDEHGDYYFLEMNTRLQVEHPVTELVTGLDLVEWQLSIAAGESLPLTQEQIRFDGHAIEVRLYAEDPTRNYLPQTGTIHVWEPANLPGVRFDTGIRSGSVVGSFYDPMLAKIIVHATTRARACRLLQRALKDTVVLGLQTNRALLGRISAHPTFVAGKATSRFLGEEFDDLPVTSVQPPEGQITALAALLFYLESGREALGHSWVGWHNSSPNTAQLSMAAGDFSWTPVLQPLGRGALGMRFEISFKDPDASQSSTHEIEVVHNGEGEIVAVIGGVQERLRYCLEGEQLYLDGWGGSHFFRETSKEPSGGKNAKGTGKITAQMDGSITGVFVSIGDRVERGQVLLVMDAMKMEHPLKSDVDGVVAQVTVQPGAQVKNRQLLVQIESETENNAQAADGE